MLKESILMAKMTCLVGFFQVLPLTMLVAIACKILSIPSQH